MGGAILMKRGAWWNDKMNGWIREKLTWETGEKKCSERLLFNVHRQQMITAKNAVTKRKK